MRKPDDELKLDINEIFGDDWTKAPESVPEAPIAESSASPSVSEEAPSESDIKFNDLSNTPAVEPMVITMKSKMNNFNPGVESEQVSEYKTKSTPVETTNTRPTEGESPSIIIKSGITGRRSEPQDFFIAYDQFRQIFLEELKDSAGPRKTSVMLVKTFEAAREKNPEVFRNANWDVSGNLLEDGSLNVQRMLDNKNALDQKQADIILDSALVFLLNLRLQAIEKGLGADSSNKIRTRLKKWADETSQKDGYGKEDPKILRRLSNYLL